MKVLTLQHLRDGELREKLNQVGVGELIQPLPFVPDRGELGIKNLEDLFLVRLGVRGNLLRRKRLARYITARGIAYQSSRISNEKDHSMAKLLEVPQFAD